MLVPKVPSSSPVSFVMMPASGRNRVDVSGQQVLPRYEVLLYLQFIHSLTLILTVSSDKYPPKIPSLCWYDLPEDCFCQWSSSHG